MRARPRVAHRCALPRVGSPRGRRLPASSPSSQARVSDAWTDAAARTSSRPSLSAAVERLPSDADRLLVLAVERVHARSTGQDAVPPLPSASRPGSSSTARSYAVRARSARAAIPPGSREQRLRLRRPATVSRLEQRIASDLERLELALVGPEMERVRSAKQQARVAPDRRRLEARGPARRGGRRARTRSARTRGRRRRAARGAPARRGRRSGAPRRARARVRSGSGGRAARRDPPAGRATSIHAAARRCLSARAARGIWP